MARRAVRDTYGIERVGDVEIRRKIVAGDTVPAHFEVEDGALEDFEPRRAAHHERDVTQRVKIDGERTEFVGRRRQASRKSQAADHPAAADNVEEDARDEADEALTGSSSERAENKGVSNG